MVNVYLVILTQLVVLSATSLVSCTPILELPENIHTAKAEIIHRRAAKDAATLPGLITKFDDLLEQLEAVNERLYKEQQQMERQSTEKGKNQNKLNMQDLIITFLRQMEQDIKQHDGEANLDIVQEDTFQNLATELSDLQGLLKKIKERLVTAKEQFCFNPYGVCCYDGCG